MKHIIIALCLIATPTYALDFYVEMGAGVFIDNSPEAFPLLQSPLGRAAFGLQTSDDWIVELEHISSIPEANDGSGINTLWVTKRIVIK